MWAKDGWFFPSSDCRMLYLAFLSILQSEERAFFVHNKRKCQFSVREIVFSLVALPCLSFPHLRSLRIQRYGLTHNKNHHDNHRDQHMGVFFSLSNYLLMVEGHAKTIITGLSPFSMQSFEPFPHFYMTTKLFQSEEEKPHEGKTFQFNSQI